MEAWQMVEQKCLLWQFKKLWEDKLTPKIIADMSVKIVEERRSKKRTLILQTIPEETAMDEDIARETREDDVAAPMSLLPAADISGSSSTPASTPSDDEVPLREVRDPLTCIKQIRLTSPAALGRDSH